MLKMEDVKPMKSTPLKCFNKKQELIANHSVLPIDSENTILLFENVLDAVELNEYLSEAVKVPRTSGRSGYGIKPRKEICYTSDGKPYKYSRITHPTIKYPPHVLKVVEKFISLLEVEFGNMEIVNIYRTLSNGVDIIYDSTFPRGGSISAHKDNEEDWGMVLIYSLGQTRYLRIRNDETRKFYNVQMEHNSLVVMHGPTFQKKYTHQVDKHIESEDVGIRLSLNLRFIE